MNNIQYTKTDRTDELGNPIFIREETITEVITSEVSLTVLNNTVTNIEDIISDAQEKLIVARQEVTLAQDTKLTSADSPSAEI